MERAAPSWQFFGEQTMQDPVEVEEPSYDEIKAMVIENALMDLLFFDTEDDPLMEGP
ncbi:MAG: hypothetical protein AAFN63_03730 [Pseudomonadota bacterium]